MLECPVFIFTAAIANKANSMKVYQLVNDQRTAVPMLSAEH